MTREEIKEKALILERAELIEWLIEEILDNNRMIEIIKKYEEYSNATINEEHLKTLQEELYIENVKAVINGKELNYNRYRKE